MKKTGACSAFTVIPALFAVRCDFQRKSGSTHFRPYSAFYRLAKVGTGLAYVHHDIREVPDDWPTSAAGSPLRRVSACSLTSTTPRGTAAAARDRPTSVGPERGTGCKRTASVVRRTGSDSWQQEPANRMDDTMWAVTRRKSSATCSDEDGDPRRWQHRGRSAAPNLAGRCGDASGRGNRSWPVPWRGTKPTEGEGVGRLATVGRRYGPDSGAKPRGRGSSIPR